MRELQLHVEGREIILNCAIRGWPSPIGCHLTADLRRTGFGP